MNQQQPVVKLAVCLDLRKTDIKGGDIISVKVLNVLLDIVINGQVMTWGSGWRSSAGKRMANQWH
eukprot:12419842-Ditylum_brightwellii.AAC.1